MTSKSISCHTVPQVWRTLRAMTELRALDSQTRFRLVLSVLALARAVVDSAADVHDRGDADCGAAVTLVLGHQPGRSDGTPPTLTAVIESPAAPLKLDELELPLPAECLSDNTVVWRLPRPSLPTQARPRIDHGADEDDLGLALAHIDELTVNLRRLKHELAETNSGVLALYVQLEEQEEEVRRAHGKVLRELEDALRPPPLAIPGLEFGVHYAPADSEAPTGGDLYDWFPLADGTVHITVVDALGHGVKSTRSALNVTHAVRTLALEGHPLHTIIARTDEILLPFDRELMATVLLARLDPRTGELELANGSHPPSLLLRADGTGDFLEARGRGIGYPLPGSDKPLRTRMHPGDLLILYTDGLTESRRDPTEGELRLLSAARRHQHRRMEEIPHAIASDMHTVILHSDDTLALAVRLTEPAETPPRRATNPAHKP